MSEARDDEAFSGRDASAPPGPWPSARLDSPERVRLDLELAGPMSRAFAYSIDYAIVMLGVALVLLVSVSGLQQIFEWASGATFLQDLFDSMIEWAEDTENYEEFDESDLFRGSPSRSVSI